VFEYLLSPRPLRCPSADRRAGAFVSGVLTTPLILNAHITMSAYGFEQIIEEMRMLL